MYLPASLLQLHSVLLYCCKYALFHAFKLLLLHIFRSCNVRWVIITLKCCSLVLFAFCYNQQLIKPFNYSTLLHAPLKWCFEINRFLPISANFSLFFCYMWHQSESILDTTYAYPRVSGLTQSYSSKEKRIHRKTV